MHDTFSAQHIESDNKGMCEYNGIYLRIKLFIGII